MRQPPNLASRPLLDTRPVWIAAGVAAVVAAVLVLASLNLYFNAGRTTDELRARRDALRAEQAELLTDLRREAAQLEDVPWEELGREVDRINAVLERYRFSWLRLLTDLGDTLPRQVRLVEIRPSGTDEGLTLDLFGVAQTREAMLTFLQNLIDSPHFERPIPRSEQTPEGASVPGYTFTVKVSYRPEVSS